MLISDWIFVCFNESTGQNSDLNVLMMNLKTSQNVACL